MPGPVIDHEDRLPFRAREAVAAGEPYWRALDPSAPRLPQGRDSGALGRPDIPATSVHTETIGTADDTLMPRRRGARWSQAQAEVDNCTAARTQRRRGAGTGALSRSPM